jgi:hypothetical protein
MPRIVYNNRTGCFQVCLDKHTPPPFIPSIPPGGWKCAPSDTCNVCPGCCLPYLVEQTDCDNCVKDVCKW